MGKVKDLTGQRFSRLLVLERRENTKANKARWACLCDCGTEVVAIGAELLSGHTKSCGCLQKSNRIKHGLHDTRQYQIWADMKARCDNQSNKFFNYYGGRGIGYDAAWESFEVFWGDMGSGYSDELTLDRIDNSNGYSKENCRWATRSTQQRNQRKRSKSKNYFKGVRKTPSGRYAARARNAESNAHLGVFETEVEAAAAYDDKCEELGCGRPNGTTRTTGE